jgi:glycosyltransferase involved in cell wall biosynthesis
MTQHPEPRRQAILMIAYTNYETDPRVIRAAEAAVEAGFDVDFLALRRPGQSAEEMVRGVRLLRLPQERFRGKSRGGYVLAYATFFLRCLAAAARRFRSRRYRIVHVNNMPDILVFAALVPKLFGSKVILDIHDPMPETFGAKYATRGGGRLYRLLLLMERLSVAFADRTVTVNDPVRDGILIKRGGYRPEQIGVIANFADDRLFAPATYPAIQGRTRFVFHGTILERYGLRTLVAAVAAMQHRDRIHIRLIGEGDFSETLKRLIAEHGLAEAIEFDNRMYPLREIPRRLADCHAGLVPLDITPISDFALPLKLIEYTCLGLPSVTVTSTAITHYLKPDECLFFPPGDVTALAGLLDRIAQNPDCLTEYRRRLPAAQRRMSWSREKQKYVAMLRELAGAGAAARTPEPNWEPSA